MQDSKTLFLYGICSKTLFIEAGSIASNIDDKQGVALTLMLNGQLQDKCFICTLKSDKYLHINLNYLWYKMSPLGYIMFCYYINTFFTLLYRKRQHSGEAVKHTTTPASIHSQSSAAQDSDFVARRNLGHQLASPQVGGREGSPAGSAVSR